MKQSKHPTPAIIYTLPYPLLRYHQSKLQIKYEAEIENISEKPEKYIRYSTYEHRIEKKTEKLLQRINELETQNAIIKANFKIWKEAFKDKCDEIIKIKESV